MNNLMILLLSQINLMINNHQYSCCMKFHCCPWAGHDNNNNNNNNNNMKQTDLSNNLVD